MLAKPITLLLARWKQVYDHTEPYMYCLLQDTETLKFAGTPEYHAHKKKRFRRADNPDIASNEAFLLKDPETRNAYKSAYQSTRALYYRE